MFSVRFFKNMWFLPLLSLPLLAWLWSPVPDEAAGDVPPDQINLALRRTADALLRASGDSTSRIPAIEPVGAGVWRIRLEQPFRYESLPALLQASLDLYGIRQPYVVAVRRCADDTIDLGYHQLDYLKKNNRHADGQNDSLQMNPVRQAEDVPCGGREMPEGCHFIEITFSETTGKHTGLAAKTGVLLLILGGLIGFWISRRRKPKPVAPDTGDETEWLEFGNTRLDVVGQVLFCADVRQTLTFRETKLLRLFAATPNRLLERDVILREVWADEGILVGRSVDVFVSRLRKKLAADPSIGIVAVHGVGYRLETGKDV